MNPNQPKVIGIQGRRTKITVKMKIDKSTTVATKIDHLYLSFSSNKQVKVLTKKHLGVLRSPFRKAIFLLVEQHVMLVAIEVIDSSVIIFHVLGVAEALFNETQKTRGICCILFFFSFLFLLSEWDCSK